MRTSIIKSYEFLVLIFAIIILIGIEPSGLVTNKTALLFPPKDMKYFTFGYQEVIADLLWVRSLQDFDLCGEASSLKAEVINTGASQPGEALKVDNLVAKCSDGWSSRMLDSITELAPKFKMPYVAGATILSAVVHDNVGAGRIFKKGVDRFPTDWTMSYRAAYHFMAGLGDFKTAAEYLVNAGKNGAPAWVFGLAARLQSKVGQAVLAKPILEEAIDADPNSKWAPDLQKRLDEINKIIEKAEQ